MGKAAVRYNGATKTRFSRKDNDRRGNRNKHLSQHALKMTNLARTGDNMSGELGIGKMFRILNVSVQDISYISAGLAQGMAIKIDGTLLGWGNNFYGH